MKNKALTGLLALTLALSAYYNYTHSEAFVTAGYEKYVTEACEGNPFCVIGAEVTKREVVSCMRTKFLSTSEKNFNKCLNKAVDKFNKEN